MSPVLGNIVKKIGENADRILLVVTTAVITIIIVSRSKDKAYKALLKQHDEETAKRLAEEMDRKIDELKEKYDKNEDELKEKINKLFEEFGLEKPY